MSIIFAFIDYNYITYQTSMCQFALVFQRIFYGLSMTSTVYADKVRVWTEPYTRGQDQLSVLSSDYQSNIVGNFSADSGVLELVQKGGPELTKNDWDKIINLPTYRLYINVRIV